MSEILVIVRYNAPLQPIDRGHFEDPLIDYLQTIGGEVTGGGTQMKEDGIEYAETEVALRSRDDIPGVIAQLEQAGAPKGSLLLDGDKQIPFGRAEGLALHLNGVDLPDEVYQQCDFDTVVQEMEKAIAPDGRFLTYWQGGRETSLFFYGSSFESMRAATAAFVASYPLCQRSRVEQVA
jgi:hypothetical protein